MLGNHYFFDNPSRNLMCVVYPSIFTESILFFVKKTFRPTRKTNGNDLCYYSLAATESMNKLR